MYLNIIIVLFTEKNVAFGAPIASTHGNY